MYLTAFLSFPFPQISLKNLLIIFLFMRTFTVICVCLSISTIGFFLFREIFRLPPFASVLSDLSHFNRLNRLTRFLQI